MELTSQEQGLLAKFATREAVTKHMRECHVALCRKLVGPRTHIVRDGKDHSGEPWAVKGQPGCQWDILLRYDETADTFEPGHIPASQVAVVAASDARAAAIIDIYPATECP